MPGHNAKDTAFIGNRNVFESIHQRKAFDEKGLLQQPFLLFRQIEFLLKRIQKGNLFFHGMPSLNRFEPWEVCEC